MKIKFTATMSLSAAEWQSGVYIIFADLVWALGQRHARTQIGKRKPQMIRRNSAVVIEWPKLFKPFRWLCVRHSWHGRIWNGVCIYSFPDA